MLGALIGDIVGSQFEFNNYKGKDFDLFTKECQFTDDSLMTLAVAKALLICKGDYSDLGYIAELSMKDIAHIHPNVGWGMRFYNWLFKGVKLKDGFGNGAAMRISPVAWVSKSIDEVKELSHTITNITHGHPEGLKGAESIAVAIFLARIGKDKTYIKKAMSEYYPIINDKYFNMETLFKEYGYDENGNWVTCQGSVPQAIVAFLESENFEDAIRNAICMGGDSDTIGAMTGSIAEAYYDVPIEFEDKAMEYLTDDLRGIYYAFNTIKSRL